MKSQAHGRFVDLQREALSAFDGHDYDKVFRLVDQVNQSYPEKRYRTKMWEICAHAMQGAVDKAFAVGFEGLDEGLWWNPNQVKEESRLLVLRGDARFERFVYECEKMYEAVKGTLDPVLVTMGNKLSDKRLFAIHWRGDNATCFSEFFEDAPSLADWHMAFPQSSQAFGAETFCWDDEKQAARDVKESYDAFDEISVKGSNTIISGASQGGKLAIDYALKHRPLRDHRFITIVPSIKDLSVYEALLQEGVCSKVRGYILTGEHDPYLSKQRALHQMFLDYDVPCRLVIVKGMGHEFPEAFDKYVEEALAFLNE
ncbi:alpha/beta hydrolase [Alteribacter aurantiacus]|uniref:alpha/beta hydrolase n=1 Tax=Alteribacter aurantiacus TaxID=254410 RepID=UPI00040DBFFC|nr:alpha/beta hydrolase [Alteribacter aurantiacus]